MLCVAVTLKFFIVVRQSTLHFHPAQTPQTMQMFPLPGPPQCLDKSSTYSGQTHLMNSSN